MIIIIVIIILIITIIIINFRSRPAFYWQQYMPIEAHVKRLTILLGSMSPSVYERQCRFYNIPQELEKWESWEMRPMVLHPNLKERDF